MRIPHSPAALAALALAVLFAGCVCEEPVHHRVGHYVDPSGDLATLDRVALLALGDATDHPRVAEDMTDALYAAVVDRRLFHVALVFPEAGNCPAPLPPHRETYTLRDLAEMRRALGTDAVLLGNVRQFAPWPRMRIGLYLRLLDLRTGRLLWAIDHVWDASEEDIRRRMEAFCERELGHGPEPLDWELATVSPRVFGKYVAWEVARTLPRLHPTAAPARAEASSAHNGQNAGKL